MPKRQIPAVEGADRLDVGIGVLQWPIHIICPSRRRLRSVRVMSYEWPRTKHVHNEEENNHEPDGPAARRILGLALGVHGGTLPKEKPPVHKEPREVD